MRRERKELLFLLPAIIYLIVTLIYPFLTAINFSLHSIIFYKREWPFIGAQNYIRLLTDFNFYESLGRTLTFVFVSTFTTIAIGVLEAYVLYALNPKRKEIFVVLFTLPLAIAPVVTGFGFRFAYHESTGIITAWLLPLLGIKVRTILGNPNLAIWGIIAADIWSQSPLPFLICLAGLSSQPKEPLEAAVIDGASGWQIFRLINLPLLKPFILVSILLRIVDAFKVFDIIWVTTQGGPGRTSTTLNILAYETGFINYHLGRGIALGIILLYITLGLVLLTVRFLRKED